MKGFKSAGFILVGALALAGCGGGGGDGGTSVELVGLDDGNATAAASTAYYALSTADMAPDLGAIAVPAAAQQPGDGRFVLRDFAKEQLDKMLRSGSQFNTSTVRAAAAETVEEVCSGGGRIIFTYNDVEPIGDSPGDSATVRFENCIEGTEKANGSLVLTLRSITERAVPYLFAVEAAFTFNNLQFISGGESISVNGTYVYSETEDDATSTIKGSSGSLTFVHTVGSVTRSTTLRDYSTTTTENYTTWVSTFTYKGTIDDSVLGGGITVETLEPFVSEEYDYYPSKGKMKITGKNKSSVTLTVIDSTYVELAIDANGDGVAETTKSPILWTALDV